MLSTKRAVPLEMPAWVANKYFPFHSINFLYHERIGNVLYLKEALVFHRCPSACIEKKNATDLYNNVNR